VSTLSADRTCPACGGPNRCGLLDPDAGGAPCWCASVVIPASITRANDPARCLCQACAGDAPADGDATAVAGVSRRTVLCALGALSLLPLATRAEVAIAPDAKGFRVRTITAGVELSGPGDFAAIDKALRFLERAKAQFVADGYEVQTTRITTQPLAGYLPEWHTTAAIAKIAKLDAHLAEAGVVWSIGPALTGEPTVGGFAQWAADLVAATKQLSFSVVMASADRGLHRLAIRAAAEATVAIAASSPNGEGNFRFAASAFIPPGTPFFPVGYHRGEPAFSIGLESATLVQQAFAGGVRAGDATNVLRQHMNAALRPVQAIAMRVAGDLDRKYTGIDTSPAPMLDASIGQAIETLTGKPFGAPGTLAACAAITAALKNLDVLNCGYCGLMLPVLEDPVLAKRAGEARFRIGDLLSFSSVCGTGLDVVPIPGDTSADGIEAIMTDVAALAVKYQKALSARLFPVPGKRAGELATFDSPYLVDAKVMSIG